MEILEHNINEERESRTPEGFVHMKTIEEMEEVNIYSDVSEQRSEWSFLFGLLLKTPQLHGPLFYTSLRVYPFG